MVLFAPFIDSLHRAAGEAFAPEQAGTDGQQRKLMIIVAAVASTALMLELLLARLFPFFLGNISAFLAIPVTMFGLGLGALVLHWLPGKPAPRTLPALLALQWVVTLLALLGAFYLFNDVFNLTHNRYQNPRTDALKTLSLSLVFVPPFAVTGVILSTAFSAAAKRVGRLYAVDLMGSAGACLVAPILLHIFDMPLVLAFLLAVLALSIVLVFSARRALVAALALPLTLLLLGLASQQAVFDARPDPEILGTRIAKGRAMKEIRHRWNEISRVTLMEFWNADKEGRERRRSWSLIHDDGISNVGVVPYSEKRSRRPPRLDHSPQGLPWLLDEPPHKALVIFAGAGKDMVIMHRHSRGTLNVTGIELQGLIKEMATERGDDLDDIRDVEDPWGLRAFYDLPEVDLRIAEGRAFLNGDDNKYDLIYAANNGAQFASRTGHSRKFLDTYEAMGAYLDHLAPGGSLVFARQPLLHKIEIFKRLFAERGFVPLDQAGAFMGAHRGARPLDTMILKPDGLSPAEVSRILEHWPRTKRDRRVNWCKAAPGHAPKDGVADIIARPPDPDRYVPTDNQPYDRGIRFDWFEWSPSEKQFGNDVYAMDWAKTFALILFWALSALVIGLFYLRPRGGGRLPVVLALYFLVTGLSYMFAQIGLMAKLELFMGNPLYSIAVVLAAFLLANGAGAAWMGRRQEQEQLPAIAALAGAAGLAVLFTLAVTDGLLLHLLSLPVAVKAVLALLTVAPLAFVLGTFYPLGVSLTVKAGHEAQVPMTFGLATLSSVLGSTYAMVAVIQLGFRDVILHAVAGYALLALAGWWAQRDR